MAVADALGDRPRAARQRSDARLRGRAAAAVIAAVATAGAAPTCAAPASARPRAVSATQELAILTTSHRVVSSPDGGSATAGTIPATRPLAGGSTILPIIGRATAIDGARWLRVMLPGRPNGNTGWVEQQGTVVTTTSWHVVVLTSTRRVLVYNRGHLLRSFAAIVGRPGTPTPHGRFFVEESIIMPARSAGAPFALALSARSAVLQEFAGGPGQIAIHGLDNLAGQLGTAVSHGCVRIADSAVTWLAQRIGPGVPVTIL